MMNVERTIISQYANSPTIVQLIQNMNEYIDPRTNFDDFYDYVWNVDTAQGFGLDILGRIVDVGRVLQIAETINYFGFNEALPGSYPFDEFTFYDGFVPATNAYVLSDDAYRRLILVKALANISATNARSLNQLLTNLFIDRGRAYVLDPGGMRMVYVFEFALTPFERAIVTQSNALPRPAGVGVDIVTAELPLFGFSEAGTSASPFGQGVFVPAGDF